MSGSAGGGCSNRLENKYVKPESERDEERAQHMRDVLFPLYLDWRADELDHG